MFRNEGIDGTHNPEFTSLEFYMAYHDYRDLITLTEDVLRKLCLEIYGTDHVLIPQFDIDHKVNTKGESQQVETKHLELDFRGPFQKFDVLTELQVDPMLLTRHDELRPYLQKRISEDILPIIARSDKQKAKKIDGTMR